MSKLFNKKYIKISREHYGQLQLLVDWLVLKSGGIIELPSIDQMRQDLNDMDSILIPKPDGTATVMLRKAVNGSAIR